jgi:hypothetical protein
MEILIGIPKMEGFGGIATHGMRCTDEILTETALTDAKYERLERLGSAVRLPNKTLTNLEQ